MSRTFPRALFFCFRSLFVVFFAYVVRAGHDVHRRGHGRRRPLRGLSVASRDAIDATPARRRGGADRSLRRSAAAARLGAARGMDSKYWSSYRTPPGRLAISAARARPGAARAPRPALETEEYKARRRKAERSLKPPPTLPTRLALGLALLGLLPSPEVVIPIILVRRRRAPVRSVVALVEAPAAALARREVLGPRLLAAVADLCVVITTHRLLTKRTLRQPQLSFWQWPQRQLSSFGGSPLCLPRSNLRPPSLLRLRLLLLR